MDLSFKMKIQNEFSQNAEIYDNFNVIQTKVVAELIGKITEKPESILDIGCGRGAVYKFISWPLKKFVGIDFAEGMIKLYPKKKNVELYVNQKSFYFFFIDDLSLKVKILSYRLNFYYSGVL